MPKYPHIFWLFLLSFFLVQCTPQADTDSQPYLVVLSMDGFRWDYADKANTPNIDKIASSGVKARAMIPSFPTKTFPNHYTMATGLYPDHHGIVLNSFYDPDLNRYYKILDTVARNDGNFYGGEPIWNTAENQGLKTGTLFWVGSEADVQGIRPSTWKHYQHDMPYGDRVDTVISWLQKPAEIRPHLIMWYFDEPDGIGHYFGPDSDEIVQEVEYLDSLVGVFINKLEQIPIHEKVNFILTSDHGMGSISEERMVMVSEHIDSTWIDEAQGGNPIWTLKVLPGYESEIESALASIDHIQWWPSPEVPERLHYGSNTRTLDYVVVADSAWSVFYDKKGSYWGGTHGYDNANMDMHTIFYATGPAFKTGAYIHPVFPNVSLYPLMCEVLGLNPAPNDGNLEDVKGMLRER